MNDDARFERLLGDDMHALAPTRAPDQLRNRIKSETSGMAPRPRWLALIKETPMRTNSRLAVGSPTWRVAAVIAATMLVATLTVGASFAGAQLLAKDGFIVDASGGGTHTSIAAAVVDADEGAVILVRPGTYEEAFEVDKTLTIRGDGPVEDIVVTAPEGGPTVVLMSPNQADPYAIHITAGEPIVAGLTFRGQASELIVTGGRPTLEGLVFEDVAWVFDGSTTSQEGSSVLVMGVDAHLTLRDSVIQGGGPVAVFDGAGAIIDGNRLEGGPQLYLPGRPGPGTIVSGNTVSGTLKYGLNIHDTSGTEITGNTFTDYGQSAIRVRDGGDGRISGNFVEGGSNGITINAAHGLEVSGNTVTDTQFGISWRGEDGMLDGNSANGNSSGIVINSGSPVVVGNTACDNTSANFLVRDLASPEVGENDFCEEPVTE
jgi:parallel beta-helix repeat protein